VQVGEPVEQRECFGDEAIDVIVFIS
jgi:hypothetical protein